MLAYAHRNISIKDGDAGKDTRAREFKKKQEQGFGVRKGNCIEIRVKWISMETIMSTHVQPAFECVLPQATVVMAVAMV